MTAQTPTAATPYDELATAMPRHSARRSREELEALAADFVNSTLHRLPPATRRPLPKPVLAAMAGAAGTVLLALLAWTYWPTDEAVASPESAPALSDPEQWTRRLEAERERKRQELERSRQYLAKMAAADSALVQEMSNRAQSLASRADRPAPRARAEEPTPRVAVTAAAAAASPAPRQDPAPARAEPQATSKPATQPQAPPQAAATGAPAAVAAAPECKIHVSELSSSGKLTYADVARMKGVRAGSDGHVFTPPLKAADGRSVVFEVMPSGCVRVSRNASR